MTGSGTVGDPYIIWSAIDLQNMELDLAAYYELGQDIDASATSGWNGGDGFVPIGQSLPHFTGSLNGRGYTISSLTIDRSAEDFVGLFGYVLGGLGIKNINVTSVDITGKDYVGSLIGLQFEDNTISFCCTSGAIVGEQYIGGLIGACSGTTVVNISDSSSSCSVTSVIAAGVWNSVGGFLGEAWKVTSFECHATGNVVGVGEYVGGFIGWGRHDECNRCYATGDVSTGDNGGDSYAGGFVGWADGVYTDCYARGDVTATGDYVGGFAGRSDDMENCYSTGLVTGVGSVGGLNGAEGGVTTDCFWDTETSGTAASAGGTGKTTAEMKNVATFPTWNFATIWAFSETTTQAATDITATTATLNGLLDFSVYNDLYPILQWYAPLSDCTFQWGETIAYGNETAVQQKVTAESFSQVIGGLVVGTTYHFRTHAAGSDVYGDDISFGILVSRGRCRGHVLIDPVYGLLL